MFKLFGAFFLSFLLLYTESAAANDCRYWQIQINKVNRWIRYNNDPKKQKDWQKQLAYLREQQGKCQGKSSPPISVSHPRANSTQPYSRQRNYIKPMRSDLQDPELNQLIASCNQWIQNYNQQPTIDNQSTRDTACRAAKNREAHLTQSSATQTPKMTRSIKECIKPNNVIDDDVKACMQGLTTKTW